LAQLSADRRFAIAYNAALTLATIVLHASGYRAVGLGAHWSTIQALPEIMGSPAQARADYLDACRTRRNLADYSRAGVTSDAEAAELLEEAKAFRADAVAWLGAHHPSLLPAP